MIYYKIVIMRDPDPGRYLYEGGDIYGFFT